MLRKKLKLTDDPELELGVPQSEFSLSSFTNQPKPQLWSTCSSTPHPQISHHPISVDAVFQLHDPVPETQSAVNITQPQTWESEQLPLWKQVHQLELQLCEALLQIPLPSEVAATYNPIEYAAELHLAYMQRFLTGHKPVLFLGMNPGPWGMCQTGVCSSFSKCWGCSDCRYHPYQFNQSSTLICIPFCTVSV